MFIRGLFYAPNFASVLQQSTCTTDLMCTCTSNTLEPEADDDTSAATISGSELQGYSQLLTAVDASVASGYKEGYYIGYARHRDGSDIGMLDLTCKFIRFAPRECFEKSYSERWIFFS